MKKKTHHFVNREENTEADVTFTNDRVIITINTIGETDYRTIIQLFEELQVDLNQSN